MIRLGIVLVYLLGVFPATAAVETNRRSLDLWENLLTAGAPSSFLRPALVQEWKDHLQRNAPSVLPEYTYRTAKETTTFLQLKIPNTDELCAYYALGISPLSVYQFWIARYQQQPFKDLLVAVIARISIVAPSDAYARSTTLPWHRSGSSLLAKAKTLYIDPNTPICQEVESWITTHYKMLAPWFLRDRFLLEPGKPEGALRATIIHDPAVPSPDHPCVIDLLAEAAGTHLKIMVLKPGGLQLSHQHHLRATPDAPTRYLLTPPTATHVDRLEILTQPLASQIGAMSLAT